MIGNVWIWSGFLVLFLLFVLLATNTTTCDLENYTTHKTQYADAIIDSNTTSANDNSARYDKDNLDIEYHLSESEILEQSGETQNYIFDSSGNATRIPVPSVGLENTLYYSPGSYPFGTSNYVPNYEDSVYLSKLTNETAFVKYHDNAVIAGGFCEKYKNQPLILEEKCKEIQPDQCASTNCCVLLGGAKCVSGNENGPTMKTNYADVYLKNRDYYYFQGKCYGNCEDPPSNAATRPTGFHHDLHRTVRSETITPEA